MIDEVDERTAATGRTGGVDAPAASSLPAIRPLLLVGAGALVAVIRWWTSHRRELFHITPDEPGQLAIARFVGGMARWNMFDRSTWRPAYGTLIAPLHWMTDDPVVAFQLALVVNALLGGLACVLLCLLARRLTTLSGAGCVIAGVLVALAPAVLFSTNWTWSESLVVVTCLGALLAALRFYDAPALGQGLAVVLLATVGFAAHSRLLPLFGLAVVLVVVVVLQRRLPARMGAVVVGIGAVALWGVVRYSAWLVDRIWETPTTTNSADGVVDRLTSPGPIAVSLAGQVWYQLVATAGLAGVGAIVLGAAALGRRRAEKQSPSVRVEATGLGHGGRRPTGRRSRPSTGETRPPPAAARIVLVACGALIALAVVFMSDRLRPDQIVYGRYNDAVVGPLVVVGIGALVTASRRLVICSVGVVLAVLGIAAVLVEAARGDALAEPGTVRAMVLGLAAFTGFDAIDVSAISVVAALVIAVVAVAALVVRRRRRWWPVVAVLVPVLAVGYVRTGDVVDVTLNSWAINDASIERLRDALPSGQPVRFRVVPNSQDPTARWGDQRLRTMVYQFYLPTNAMTEDGAEVAPGYVFAPIGDPDLTAAGGEVRWRDPRFRIGLWLVPS